MDEKRKNPTSAADLLLIHQVNKSKKLTDEQKAKVQSLVSEFNTLLSGLTKGTQDKPKKKDK
jgi:hypothetical protein